VVPADEREALRVDAVYHFVFCRFRCHPPAHPLLLLYGKQFYLSDLAADMYRSSTIFIFLYQMAETLAVMGFSFSTVVLEGGAFVFSSAGSLSGRQKHSRRRGRLAAELQLGLVRRRAGRLPADGDVRPAAAGRRRP
jgi:hypothetical protein